jgi:hypothetical protein
MKTIIFGLLLSIGVQAATSSDADTTYAKRGEDFKMALEAANLYKSAANGSRSPKDLVDNKLGEAQALYFYGNKVSTKNEKKAVYTRAYKAALSAVATSSKSKGVPAEGFTKTDLAKGHYLYAINLARWGNANGISASISKLPELMENLEIANKLDETAENFGAYRTSGRVRFKVPAALARLRGLSNFSTEDALDDLFNAYDNSLITVSEVDVQTAANTTTTVYLLDVLADLGERGDFCEIFSSMRELSKADDAIIAKYFPTKIPESKEDLKNLMACAANKDNCEKGDFQSGKEIFELSKRCR